MTNDDLRRAVLVDAAEDLTGLWEAWWEANSRFPNASLSERLALAEQAVRELLETGLIRLYRGSWADGDQREVPMQDADSVLREFKSWVATNDGPLTFILATDAGSRVAGIPPTS